MKIQNSVSNSKINNKIAFGTKYKFIPMNDIWRMMKDNEETAVELFNNMPGGHYEIVDNASRIYTQSVGPCFVPGINKLESGNSGMGHYSNYGTSDFSKYLKYTGKNSNTLAIGGFTDFMKNFFDSFINLAIEKKIPTTAFVGQTSGNTHLFWDIPEDTLYLSKQFSNGDWRSMRQVDTIDKLRNAYHVINVPEGNELYINDKFVPSELVNQNNEMFKVL